jgi:hypothetical protein
MRSRTLSLIAAMTLSAVLGFPLHMAAQERQVSSGQNNDNEPSALTSLKTLPVEAQASISTQLAKLTASGGAAFDYLGYSVAISGDTVVVGAPIVNRTQGAAYVFVKQGLFPLRVLLLIVDAWPIV